MIHDDHLAAAGDFKPLGPPIRRGEPQKGADDESHWENTARAGVQRHRITGRMSTNMPLDYGNPTTNRRTTP